VSSAKWGYCAANSSGIIGLEDLGQVVGVVEGQVDLLQHEAVDVAVEQGERMRRHRHGEARAPATSDHRIVVPQRRRARLTARFHDADRPAVTQEHRAHGPCPSPHRHGPVGVVSGQFDLGEHQVDHGVEEIALVGDVVIERHRLDPEFLCEPPHRQGVDAVGIGEVDGGARRPLAAEGLPAPGVGCRGGTHRGLRSGR
jgi:hypothetical protein